MKYTQSGLIKIPNQNSLTFKKKYKTAKTGSMTTGFIVIEEDWRL